MPPPPPEPGSHLKVVSLLDPSGLADRLSARPEQIAPAFVPVADLTRAVPAGYEALLAFDGEPPQAPRAWSRRTHAGYAGAVEAPLLRAALAARDRLPQDVFMAVSLSTSGLLSPEVAKVLADSGRLERVMLVLADAAQHIDMFAVRRALEAPCAAGATVALDETGSGYASLQQALRLRPDFVRVGEEFVREIDRDPAKAAVVETLSAFASRIDAWVIAAGIEAVAELEALRRLGIPLGQGELLGTAQASAGSLPQEAADAIRRAAPEPSAEETVEALVEWRPAVAWDASIDVLADAFLEDPRHDVLVLVDERQRPLALAERAALMRGEPYERPVMRVGRHSPLKAVARRAAARPALERFHALAVCDRHGVYLGIVRVEQLLDALAR